MLALDLFNTKYERDLAEGAVDDLEARRIDTLNDRMQDLLARAKEPAYKKNPGALASLKKQYQQVKDERDSYYKVREAGIPGNVPVEKIPGKEDLLKGRGRSYYEDQKKNSEAGPLDQKLQRLKVQARRQFPRAHTDDEALLLKLLDKETQDDRLNRQVDARQDAELRKNFALDQEQEDEIRDLQTGLQEQDDWSDDEDEEATDLRSGDYVRDRLDGESGEIFRMQGDPNERRVQILDRDGRGWYIEPSRLTRVDPQDPDVQRYFGKRRQRDMDEQGVAEADKTSWTVNVTLKPNDDINQGRGAQEKTMTVAAQSKDAAKKKLISYFLKNGWTVTGIKFTGDLDEARRVKGGDYQLKLVDKQSDNDTDLDDVVMDYYFDVYQNGQKIGTAEGDSYYGELVVKPEFDRQFKLSSFHDKDHPLMQQFEKIENGVAEGMDDDVEHLANVAADAYWSGKFGMTSATEKVKMARDIVQAVEDGRLSIEELRQDIRDLDNKGVAEGWSERALAQRTGQPQTPYAVYIDGKQWKEFATDDQARAVARKLEAKFRADGSNKKVSYAPATSVTNKPVKEDQDSSGVERAILNRIMVAHTDLLMKFGPDKVMQAAEEVAYNVGDVDEIGTSDVSAYVDQVKQILGATP